MQLNYALFAAGSHVAKLNHCNHISQTLSCYHANQSMVYFILQHNQSNSSMHHYECVALCKHQSAERPTVHQISSLMYPKIQWRQVIMNVLHPGCVRPPWWSPPVLWRRFKDGLASICILIHSCKMSKESEMTGLSDGSVKMSKSWMKRAMNWRVQSRLHRRAGWMSPCHAALPTPPPLWWWLPTALCPSHLHHNPTLPRQQAINYYTTTTI